MARNDLRTTGADRRPPGRRAVALAAAAAATLVGSPLAVPAAAEPGPEKVTDRHAVVLVNFKNASLSDAKVVHEKAVKQLFTGQDSVAAYYATMSDKRLSVVPAQGDGVFGPFDIDVDKSQCDPGKIQQLAAKALPADVKYDHLSIVIPGGNACSWWGLGSMPGPITWFQEGAINNDDTTAALHEFGHNMGFPHQERELCPVGQFTGCSAYGNSHITPMGGGGGHKGLSSPELIAKKWLSADRIVSPKTTTTVHLTPLHAPAAAAGTRAVDIPFGTNGDRLVIEYRHNVANTVDTDIENPGLFVFRVGQGNYASAVCLRNPADDKATMAGSFTGTEPLTDLAQHIKLSYSKMTPDGIDVTIDLAHQGAQVAPTTGATGNPSTTATPGPTTTSAAPIPAAKPSVPVSPTTVADTDADAALHAAKPTAKSPTRSGSPAAAAAAAAAPAAPSASVAATTAGPQLAATGGSSALVPTVIGTVFLGVGAALLLRRRRRAAHRRH